MCQGHPKNTFSAGDLASQRNFYNPEFDAKLTDYMGWMANVPGLSLLTPDDFKFRFAWWGFYDGIYDYVDPEFNDNRSNLLARFSETNSRIGRDSRFFNDQNKNFRHIYGSRNRINELYLDYTKDRFFVRAGRQAISWGESDDIALLDVSNPFDLTQGAPGFFEDLDEARIPLWTLRSTVKLVDNWRWLSSLFADVYLVPGVIDTTVPINPSPGGVSPAGAPGGDPQLQVAASGQPLTVAPIHLVIADVQPPHKWSESRWGVRLAGVLLQDYTVQGWFIRTYPEAPTPRLLNGVNFLDPATFKKFGVQIDDRGFRTPVCTRADGSPVKAALGSNVGRTPAGRVCSISVASPTVLDRRLESVIGLAATWFSQPLNGIIRTEAEYFRDELAVIPSENLNPNAVVPAPVRVGAAKFFGFNHIPKTDYLRWVVGFDRFFFFRPLNPSNSFVLSSAFHGQLNVFERREQDFRTAVTKAGKSGSCAGPPDPCAKQYPTAAQTNLVPINKNFLNSNKVDNLFATIAVQTDYLHGRLQPRLVLAALDVSGIFAFSATATYRVTDSVLLGLTYLAIESSRGRVGIGTFQDRDQVQMRVTYQLN